MKALTATALLLALSAVALAKQTPVEEPRLALVTADINTGSVGAMREDIGSVLEFEQRRQHRSFAERLCSAALDGD
jgi:hypothetical protein